MPCPTIGSLTALGPKKFGDGPRLCAGAIGLLVQTEYTAEARVPVGAAELVIDKGVVVESNPDLARAAARELLPLLATIPCDRKNFLVSFAVLVNPNN